MPHLEIRNALGVEKALRGIQRENCTWVPTVTAEKTKKGMKKIPQGHIQENVCPVPREMR